MTFVIDKNHGKLQYRTQTDVKDISSQVQESPSVLETLGAAFRAENTIVSLASRGSPAVYYSRHADENFNVFDYLKGTEFESDMRPFIGSASPEETEAIKAQIQSENKAKQRLAASGWQGIAAGVLAGVIDPLIFIPGSGAVKSVRGGYSTVKSAAVVGVSTAGQAAIGEAVLYNAQHTRTAEESAMAIGSATILGGLVGAGAAKLLTRSEHKALVKSLDIDRKNISLDLNSSTSPQALGAAATDVRQLELVGYGLNQIPVLRELDKLISPVSRIFNSGSIAARRIFADMSETVRLFKDNEQGIATTFGGSAVSRQARDMQTRFDVKTQDIMRGSYAQYRFGEEGGSVARGRFQDLIGNTPEGKLSWKEYNAQFSRALRNGDEVGIPEIDAAAKELRENVIIPMEDALKQAGMLPEDIGSPAGDKSWFARLYDRNRIIAQRPDLLNKITDWLEVEQTRKFGIQQKLAPKAEALDRLDDILSKVDRQLQTLDRQDLRLQGQMSERGMEAGRAKGRVNDLSSHQSNTETQIKDIEDLISSVRQNVSDSQTIGIINDLEKELSALKRSEAREAVSLKDLDRIEADEMKGILDEDTISMAADIAIGKRNLVKEPSFVSWLKKHGGLKDDAGDLFAAVGSHKVRPGLISRNGRHLDDMTEVLWNEFGEYLPYRPSTDDLIRWIEDDIGGRGQPFFLTESLPTKQRQAIEASRLAAQLDEAMSRSGTDAKTRSDIAKYLRGESSSITEADLDKLLSDMDSSGNAVSAQGRREGLEGALGYYKNSLQRSRELIHDAAAQRKRLQKSQSHTKKSLTQEERTLSRQQRRQEILAERQVRQAEKQDLLQRTVKLAEEQRAKIFAEIEEELGNWGGKSAKDGLSAIKARNKASVGRDPNAPRLESADDSTLRSLNRILDSDRTLSRQELQARADEIIDRIVGSPDGRLPYDDPSYSGASFKGLQDQNLQGSLNPRDFAIPSDLIEDFLINDVEEVMRTAYRSIIPDLLLKERFGDVNMTSQIKQIQEEYAAKANTAKTEKERIKLHKERDSVISTIANERDRIRGVYGLKASQGNLGRIASVFKSLNMASMLGGATLNSMADATGVVMRYGLTQVLSAGWAPYFKGLTTSVELRGAMKRQAHAASVGFEMVNNMRMNSIADIGEYRSGSPFEKTVRWIGEKSQIINLQAPWTDELKIVATTVSSDNYLRSVKNIIDGKASAKEIRDLASAGIDAPMAKRIYREFYENGGGDTIDGVRLANTNDWADKAAAKRFNEVLARDADALVVTPGSEVPFAFSNPIWSMVFQFKSFIAAAHERLLIANLQRRDFNTLQGLVGMVSMGMLGYRLYTWTAGQEVDDNPATWIKEGINRSGLMGWFDEANAISGHFTSGRADIFRVIGADKPLSRHQSRSNIGVLLGPAASNIEKAMKISSAVSRDDWSESETRAARQLLPFQNLFYVRQLLDQVEKSVNNAFGIETRR